MSLKDAKSFCSCPDLYDFGCNSQHGNNGNKSKWMTVELAYILSLYQVVYTYLKYVTL